MTSTSSFEATPVPAVEPHEQIDAFIQMLEGMVLRGEGGDLPDIEMQRLFKACIQLYAQKTDAGPRILPCGDTRDISATSIMVAASGLLKGANLELFELGMWQSFSGAR